ncbi:primase C-terminal domain-containing protein, partial [Arsenophonus nasoniae]|uniref:primase C-terminal domain-containing protein n=1 Tax=Arsenophonus nasoniae TaxID=638 RepID=UPI00054D25F2
TYGLGRNCTVFEKTRKWAYRAIRRGWPAFAQWFAACFERAMGYNVQFPVPLSEPEVKAIAKSVAKWTHKRFTEKTFAEYVARTHTPEIQSARGRKSRGGGRPTVGTHDVIDAIQEFKAKGYSHRKIAHILNISPSTVSVLSRRQ